MVDFHEIGHTRRFMFLFLSLISMMIAYISFYLVFLIMYKFLIKHEQEYTKISDAEINHLRKKIINRK